MILDIAADIAVIIYNNGFKRLLEIMTLLGLKIGYDSYNFCHEIDEHRVKASERSSSRLRKTARKIQTSARKENEEHDSNVEGMLYGPGIAE